MTFRLRLKGSKPPENKSKELAQQYIKAALKQKKKEQAVINSWVATDSTFDLQQAFATWEMYRKEYGEKITEESIKTFAISNSIFDVNSIIANQLKMENSDIDVTIFNELLGKLFIVNLSNILVEKTELSAIIKADIMQRVVAKNFPNRELRAPKQVTIPETIQDIKQQVENYVEDEPVDKGD